MPDNSVDALVTDPPYGFAFMGKKWDYDVPSVGLWKEALRVLKPGAHLLSFGGPRTYHRMACNIEDAGFEIRDQLQWLFGSGFPKSLDISKAIDKAAGAKREKVGSYRTGEGAAFKHSGDGREQLHEAAAKEIEITAPSTDLAKYWHGWGTALKPANEPIVLARKPLSEKTVAANILKWGVGGLNIDGCRIGHASTDDLRVSQSKNPGREDTATTSVYGANRPQQIVNVSGRFPANLILDETAAKMLDEQSGHLHGAGNKRPMKQTKTESMFYGANSRDGINPNMHENKGGGASRFFYVAKSSRSERNAGLEDRDPKKVNDGRKKDADNAFQRGKTLRVNTHPTVKPIKLMRYLVRLVTPPNGVVLDPFMGSGTTGIAAKLEGFEFIGIEKEHEYIGIAKARVESAVTEPDSDQMELPA